MSQDRNMFMPFIPARRGGATGHAPAAGRPLRYAGADVEMSQRRLDPSVFQKQWPLVGAALSQYQRHTAEAFCDQVYAAISHGLLRLDQRTALARQAESLGIRPFDAQLLIACTIRQWALDQGQSVGPPLRAQDDHPAGAARHKTRERWLRFLVMLLLAVALDVAIIMYYIK